MKKNKFYVLFLLVLASSIMSSCGRTGAEDPLISLGKRDKLINEDWELAEFYYTENSTEQITSNFNFAVCDTAGVTGTRVKNLFRQDTYKDTAIVSTVVNNNFVDDQSFAYDIKLRYRIRITRGGEYTCFGDYNFFDTGRSATVEGSFSTRGNAWYWEDTYKDKWAITFKNFPMIDSENISVDGAPIRYIESQTFDVLRLSPNDLWLDFQTFEDHTYIQDFDEFTVNQYNNCTKVVQTKIDIDRNLEIRMKKYDGSWED